MTNILHAALHQGNIQARPVLGELFDYGSQEALTGFFTPVDEQLAFELTGYNEQIDFVAVVDLDQFNFDNPPVPLTQLTRAGGIYTIRTRKTDQSAYVLGLKYISPAVPDSPSVSPGPGAYTYPIAVFLASPTGTIHYTTDGSSPTIASPVYSVPLAIAAAGILKAMAANGAGNSPITTVIYR